MGSFRHRIPTSGPHGSRCALGGSSIFANQARDGSATLDHCREADRPTRVVQRWSLAAGLVSPMGVIVPLVVAQHLPQVPLTVDQQVVKTLAPQCAHESFGVGVRARRSRWCSNDRYRVATSGLPESEAHGREANGLSGYDTCLPAASLCCLVAEPGTWTFRSPWARPSMTERPAG